MTTKVVSISPAASVRSAALKLRANDISGLPVIDDGGRLVGIVTEGDLLRRIAGGPLPTSRDDMEHDDPQGLNLVRSLDLGHSMGRSVADAMCRDVVTIGPDADVVDIARTLLSHRIKRVPVLHNGVVIGIVSRCDLMGVIIDAPSEITAPGDEAILLALKKRLGDLGIDPNGLSVNVSNAHVYIAGRLEPTVTRNALHLLIGSIQGVEGFFDETTIPD